MRRCSTPPTSAPRWPSPRSSAARTSPSQLAVALAVRAVRLGHVFVDLATVATTVTPDDEELEVDLAALPWPDPAAWPDARRRQPADRGGRGRTARPAPPPHRHPRLPRPLLAPRAGDRRRSAGPGRRRGARRRHAGADRRPRPPLPRRRRRGPPTTRGGDGGRASVLGDRGRPGHRQDDHGGAHRRPPARTGRALGVPPTAHRAGGAHGKGRHSSRRGRARGGAPSRRHARHPGCPGRNPGARRCTGCSGGNPGNQSRFTHDADNQLPHNVVIVDESSMVVLR